MVCTVSFLPSVWMDVRCMTTGTFGSSWGRSLGTWSVSLEQPSERRKGERRERGGRKGREGGREEKEGREGGREGGRGG